RQKPALWFPCCLPPACCCCPRRPSPKRATRISRRACATKRTSNGRKPRRSLRWRSPPTPRIWSINSIFVAPASTLRSRTCSRDLKDFIRRLAEQLNLNVIFDRQSFVQPRTIDINLRDVTTSQALDYIFLQESLFFQKLSRRTILVADQTRRPQYQQLVIRTF